MVFLTLGLKTFNNNNNMNPLLENWDLPPFDRMQISDYEPALSAAIDEAERNVEAIATNTDSPTFENTVEALENVSSRIDRISAVMFNLNECCTSDELQNVVERMDPMLTRFSLKVSTDRRLYERTRQVANLHPVGSLDVEQQTLLERTLRSFIRHGVALEEEARNEYLRNEEELSTLKLRFSQNALADTNNWTLHLTAEEDLAGLPESVREAAHDEAAARGLSGWIFTLAQPSYGPFMTYSARRDLREKMYRAYGSVGGRGNEHDNNAVIARIVELRSRQARLLGYDTYCDYVLEDRMAGSLANLRLFMQRLHRPVLPAAKRDLDEVMAEAAHDLRHETFMPWDFSYYAERQKQRLFSFDSELLRPYFRLENVRDGIFNLYNRLYGLRFERDASAPVYHPDVEVFRVTDSCRFIGMLYLDMFPRSSKRSGAWMTEFRGQHGNVRPLIQVVCNFSKPTASTPSLLRFSEVETFMHEMGHAMHGLLSQVRYESLGGTNVKRDFVELPSQLMENWCYEPEFLDTFARHWKTGEQLPHHYVDNIRRAQNHLAAWLCLRQLNLGMTDIAFHTAERVDRAEKVEADAMTNLLPRVDGCCTATNFNHIFSGGYASGYYGYKWAETLEADIFGRFKADGIFNTATAASFRRCILERGGTEHPAVLFRNFMGRDPDPDALLRRMGIEPNADVVKAQETGDTSSKDGMALN